MTIICVCPDCGDEVIVPYDSDEGAETCCNRCPTCLPDDIWRERHQED